MNKHDTKTQQQYCRTNIKGHNALAQEVNKVNKVHGCGQHGLNNKPTRWRLTVPASFWFLSTVHSPAGWTFQPIWCVFISPVTEVAEFSPSVRIWTVQVQEVQTTFLISLLLCENRLQTTGFFYWSDGHKRKLAQKWRFCGSGSYQGVLRIISFHPVKQSQNDDSGPLWSV